MAQYAKGINEMIISTEPSITYLIRLSESELADALIDASPLQDQPRQARAAQRQHETLDEANPYRSSGVSAKTIAKAHKRQNKKIEKARGNFLSASGKRFHDLQQTPRKPCPHCGKPIVDIPRAWGIHNARSHPELATKTTPVPHAHSGNTFPLNAPAAE